MSDDKKEPKKALAGVQVEAHFWGNHLGRALLPADARAAMNPGPQPKDPNDKTTILPARFDLARSDD